MIEKDLDFYVNDLKERIVTRMGKVEPFLIPQVEVTAKHMKLMDKILDEIYGGDLLVDSTGRGGVEKKDINPLIPLYDKMHRSVTADLAALGLNYNTAPSKVTGELQTGKEEKDTLLELLSAAKGGIKR